MARTAPRLEAITTVGGTQWPRDPLDHESAVEQSGGYCDWPAILEPIRAIASQQNDHVYQPKGGGKARAVSADEQGNDCVNISGPRVSLSGATEGVDADHESPYLAGCSRMEEAS